jgi:chromosome partitioning protein
VDLPSAEERNDPLLRQEVTSDSLFAPDVPEREEAEASSEPDSTPAEPESPARGEVPEMRPAATIPEERFPPEMEQATPLKAFPQGEIIAFANQKGGVGKTTTAISLGAALAEEGARVLLVDFDPQGALSVGLGVNPNTLQLTVYNLLLDPSISLDDVIRQSKVKGLDLLPSNIDLSAAEIQLVSEVAREQMLKRALAPAQERYHYLLIDCPPSLGLLTVNALTAADSVIVPLECEYFALRGMALLVDTIDKVRERLNPDLQIKGILATMLDSRTIHSREVLSRVTEAFGERVFKTVIRKTVRFAEAPVAGEPILTYAPRSAGAQEYRDLAREVVSR